MCGRSFTTRKVLQEDAAATGNGTPMDVAGLSQLVCQVDGITTATITWEASLDGATWYGLQATPLSTGTAAATATANGLYRLAVAGLAYVRARISAYTSGTIDVVGLGVAEG